MPQLPANPPPPESDLESPQVDQRESLRRKQPLAVVFWVLTVALAMTSLWLLGPASDAQTLVVYCAHDAEFSQPVLRDFERRTGIRVAVRFDTEATKSLGLVNRLIAEKDQSQCDVFWNNELLGTLELARQGVLEPYHGPGFSRIPAQFRDDSGLWAGFAARLRVYIAPGGPGGMTEADIGALLASPDLSRVALAKPLFGTTLTQYCLWWSRWGGVETRRYHADLLRRGLRIVDGNAATKNLVAERACDLAFTDTDDYFVARDAGKAVVALPVRVGRETICIPNTAAIIRGTRRRQAAEKLVDYLLSAETELALARSPSRQVPLGAVEEAQLSAEVRTLRAWVADAADLRPLAEARREVLDWLRLEYTP